MPELSAAAALPEISPELHQFTLQPCSSRPRASASHIVVPPARSATTDKGLAARVVVCRRRGLLLELTWPHPAKTTRVGPSGGRDEGCACVWWGGGGIGRRRRRRERPRQARRDAEGAPARKRGGRVVGLGIRLGGGGCSVGVRIEFWCCL